MTKKSRRHELTCMLIIKTNIMQFFLTPSTWAATTIATTERLSLAQIRNLFAMSLKCKLVKRYLIYYTCFEVNHEILRYEIHRFCSLRNIFICTRKFFSIQFMGRPYKETVNISTCSFTLVIFSMRFSIIILTISMLQKNS